MEIFEKYVIIVGVVAVFAIAYLILYWLFLKKQEFWVKIVAIVVCSPIVSLLTKFITFPSQKAGLVQKGIPFYYYTPTQESIGKLIKSIVKSAEVNSSGMDLERFFWNTVFYAGVFLIITMFVKSKKGKKEN